MKNLFAKLLAALLIATLLLTPVASLAEETPAVKEAAPAADAAPADDDDEEEVLIAAEPVDEIIAEAAEESVDLIVDDAELPEEEYVNLVTDEDADFALFDGENNTYNITPGIAYLGGGPGGPNTTEIMITPWIKSENGDEYVKVDSIKSIPAGTHVYFTHNYSGEATISTLKLRGEDSSNVAMNMSATKLDNSTYHFEVTMPAWNVRAYEVSTSSNTPIVQNYATLTAAPTAKELTYNGKPQELVNKGAALYGDLFYKLDTDDDWGIEIPTATEPGTYKVYYKVIGNGEDWKESYVVTVTIAPAEATVSDPAPTTVSAPTTSTPAVVEPAITIAKAPAKVKAKAAKKGKVTVSWKKIKKTKKTKALLAQIKSIEVQLSTDPSFTTDVQTKTLGKKKTKATFKKLQKNTFYYVRVRYTDGVGGVSNWSATKKVKTKKK